MGSKPAEDSLKGLDPITVKSEVLPPELTGRKDLFLIKWRPEVGLCWGPRARFIDSSVIGMRCQYKKQTFRDDFVGEPLGQGKDSLIYVQIGNGRLCVRV